MELSDYRKMIDKIDDELLRLFIERMDVARQIAAYKKANGLPALDAAREKDKLDFIGEKAGEEMRHYSQKLFELLFDLSRAYQNDILRSTSG